MDNLFFSSINSAATIADLLALSEAEFSAASAKIKAEYKKRHGITAKKKSETPLSFMLRKLRKLSKLYKENMGATSDHLKLDKLLPVVLEQNKEELQKMGYTKEQFMIDFATQVATIMTSGVYQKSYYYNCNAFTQIRESFGLDGYPKSEEVASYFVFRGTTYHKDPVARKRVSLNYPQKACAEGIDDFSDEFEDIACHFKTFDNLNQNIAKCAVVRKLYAQDENSGIRGNDVNKVLTLTDEQMSSMLPQPAEKDETLSIE